MEGRERGGAELVDSGIRMERRDELNNEEGSRERVVIIAALRRVECVVAEREREEGALAVSLCSLDINERVS